MRDINFQQHFCHILWSVYEDLYIDFLFATSVIHAFKTNCSVAVVYFFRCCHCSHTPWIKCLNFLFTNRDLLISYFLCRKKSLKLWALILSKLIQKAELQQNCTCALSNCFSATGVMCELTANMLLVSARCWRGPCPRLKGDVDWVQDVVTGVGFSFSFSCDATRICLFHLVISLWIQLPCWSSIPPDGWLHSPGIPVVNHGQIRWLKLKWEDTCSLETTIVNRWCFPIFLSHI